MKEFENKELKKATQDFCPSKIIGKGSHGWVYKGVLEDGQIVAIKKSSITLQNLQDNSKKLENEVQILSSMPKLTTNLVSPLGTSHRVDSIPNSLMLVMEYMPNGSLHDSLHGHSTPQVLLSWSNRVKLALQLARSLEFLHGLKPKVIHRDVKSPNVLFDKDWNAKLGDFGLAIRLNEDDRNRVNSVSRPAGTIGYLDPSYTTPCMLSTKNDVFSYGVVLLEIISGQKVIDPSRSKTCIVDWALPLIKNRKFEYIFDTKIVMPIYLKDTMRKMLAIATRCIGESCNRPSMDEIVYQLENSYIERVRFSVWVKFFKKIIILKRERKIAYRKRCRQGSSVLPLSSSCTTTSMGKLLLKDVLANVIH